MRRWIYKIIKWAAVAEKGEKDNGVKLDNPPDWLSGCQEVSRIYRIANGYLVQTEEGNRVIGSQPVPIVFCKDDQDIAEHLIATKVHQKINPQAQGNLPLQNSSGRPV